MHDNLPLSDRTDDVSVTWPLPPEIARRLEQLQIGKYHTKGGHGFVAEDAGVFADVMRGRRVERTGISNSVDGPDRIVNGIAVQTKYFQTPQATVNAAFDPATGRYRYQGQMLEVPADQYDACVKLFQEKIAQGKVPGVADPGEAKNIVRKGSITYKQARNIAQAGNIDSLLFDVKTQSITSGYLFGISFAVDFAWRTWNGDDPKQAIRGAIRSGIDAGNQALIIGVLSAQALRTPVAAAGAVVLRGGVRSVASTDLGRDLVQCIAAGSLGKAVYGAAAVNHVAKLLRSNAITSVVSLAVVTAPDVYRAAIAGDISWSQVAKNMAINGAGIAAGAGGWFAGVAAGAAIGSAVPIIGTAIGGVIGGICGGMMGGAAGVGGARMVLDPFIQDDSDRMIALLQDAIGALASDYLLSKHEVAELMTEVRRTVSDSWLRDMYRKGSSGGSDVDRRQFAYDSFEEACQRIVRRRSKVRLPNLDQVLSAVSDALPPNSLLLPDRESC